MQLSLELTRYSSDQWCGVYFLLQGDEVVYVGKAVNVHTRVNAHRNENKKVFDNYAFIPCALSELENAEAKYIIHYKPIFNCVLSYLGEYVSFPAAAKQTGLGKVKLRQRLFKAGYPIENFNACLAVKRAHVEAVL